MLLAVALLSSQLLCAGEPTPPPDKPEKPEKPAVVLPMTWRPIKELQDVLFYESFEHPTSAAEHGKVVAEDPAPPGGHIWKCETNTGESYMFLHVSNTPLRIPQGMAPAQIYISASVYADEGGTLTIKCVHQKGDYFRDVAIPKVKAWATVTVKLSDLKNKAAIPEIDHVIKEIEIHFKPHKNAKAIPKGWVDDILVTYNTPPADLLPRVMQAERRRLDMEKQFVRDGFTYTMAVNELLKTAVKPFKGHIKPKHVLVVGNSPDQTQAWVKQLIIAAGKLKETSFVFEAAEEPSASASVIGGLADMRMLLPYNLLKDPEFVLLIAGPEDAMGPGRPSEILRVAAERAMDAGIVPIVCIPGATSPEAKGDKIANFAETMKSQCAQFGVPLVDGGYAAKNAKGEFDATKVGPQAFEKTVLLAMTAIKHAHDNMKE